MSHFSLPDLPYDYSALEPVIDEQTMRIHHDMHHGGYTNKLNEAISGTDMDNMAIEDILSSEKLPTAVRNNGGGFWNHSLFWRIMSPDGGGEPGDELMNAIKSSFDSFDKFKDVFSTAATSRFGSGWAWLIMQDGQLKVTSTPNQDNPLMVDVEERGTPILGLDVWEHAYYLKYQNKRVDYVQEWWKLVNWEEVEKNFRNL